MKIRHGFVSNSSSTSFCIVGKFFDRGTLEKLNLIKYGELFLPASCGLDHHHDQECTGSTIGLSINKMMDNMKLSEFKEDVKNKLNSIGLDSDDIRIHVDGWYEG